MSKRRPSLAESMRQVADTEPPVTVFPSEAPAPPSSRTSAVRPPGFYAATRAGKKKVTTALDPAAHKRLKSLGVERDTTTEALLVEAISDLFVKYGKPPLL